MSPKGRMKFKYTRLWRGWLQRPDRARRHTRLEDFPLVKADAVIIALVQPNVNILGLFFSSLFFVYQ